MQMSAVIFTRSTQERQSIFRKGGGGGQSRKNLTFSARFARKVTIYTNLTIVYVFSLFIFVQFNDFVVPLYNAFYLTYSCIIIY